MGDTYRRARPGDPLAIPARVYNDLLALLEDRGPTAPASGAGGAARGTLVLARNDSGQDLGRFAVLAAGGIVFDPTDDESGFLAQPVVAGVQPTEEAAGWLLVLQEPVADGAVGRALAQGVTPVRLHVAEGQEDYGFADVCTDEGWECDRLASAVRGAAQVLWREGGTDEQWALVRLSNAPDPTPRPQVVTVVNDGGSAGNKTTACSYTYTISDLDEHKLATGLTPALARTAVGAYLAAGEGGRSDLGLAVEIEGTWHLLLALGEVPDVTNCPQE